MILAYRYRVKDKHSTKLEKMARTVNFVWNYCNDVQRHALKWNRHWPSAYDLHKLTSGTSKELKLSAATINAVCSRYERSRRQSKKAYLRYRGKRSLGWIPFRAIEVRQSNGGFRIAGIEIGVWLSREIPAGSSFRDSGSFARDARGRWYLNICIDVPAVAQKTGAQSAGIDLGLKSIATLSTGEIIQAPRLFRASEARIALSQRAKKKAQTLRLHAKIANRRKDFLHKLSTKIVREFDFIAVGDVSASKLAKTRMAKSVNDAGWSSFRTMLAYKSIANGARYAEVDEQYSTQTCAYCGSIGGPKGRKGLVIREWQCSECGSVHDRDVNAAKFILRRGLATLLEEPARLAAQERPSCHG